MKKRHFDVLQRISVAEKPEKFELVYTLYSTKENKTIDFTIYVNDKNESISHLYNDALDFENRIDERFDIIFYWYLVMIKK